MHLFLWDLKKLIENKLIGNLGEKQSESAVKRRECAADHFTVHKSNYFTFPMLCSTSKHDKHILLGYEINLIFVLFLHIYA